MNSQNLSFTFSVEQTPHHAFDAINNVRGWWSGQIEGNTTQLADEFTYRYKDIHYSRQRITEFIPDAKVVWQITDSCLQFVQDKAEWNGTEIVFEIFKNGAPTDIRFTHRGLNPKVECFEGCSSAWGFYINTSLRNLIVTGNGQPNPKEENEQVEDPQPVS